MLSKIIVNEHYLSCVSRKLLLRENDKMRYDFFAFPKCDNVSKMRYNFLLVTKSDTIWMWQNAIQSGVSHFGNVQSNGVVESAIFGGRTNAGNNNFLVKHSLFTLYISFITMCYILNLVSIAFIIHSYYKY